MDECWHPCRNSARSSGLLPTHGLLLRELFQQIRDSFRVLLGLLLHFAFPKRIQLAKEPHLLELADQSLDIFRRTDLVEAVIEAPPI